MITFQHPVHGPCEVIDKNPVTERTRSVLVRRVKDDAKLYVSVTHLESAEPAAAEAESPTPPAS